MHAYDLNKLHGEIRVRLARAGEKIKLLDGKTIDLAPDVLLITDLEGPIGLAGIMGGERTEIGADTVDVFFEVAYFPPDAIAGRSRRWGMLTDASQRYERGVDPTQQQRAVERAVALLVSISGGTPGPISVTQSEQHQPKRAPVVLRSSQLRRLLGVVVPDDRVKGTLEALQMRVVTSPTGWEATPPAYRFDVTIEADLIEEVARIVGFDAIPEADAPVPQRFHSAPEEVPSEHTILETLAMRGYQEAVTFAFVDPGLQTRLFPDRPSLALSNPIASDLSVMRVSLWPGLLRAAQENQRRQQDRIRLFEHGARFMVSPDGQGTVEIDTLAGIACGPRLPEQWGIPRDLRGPADFYDVKSDLEALFIATGASSSFSVEPAALSCLHPGRSARILRNGREVGFMGELHPTLVRELDFTYSPVLFELDLGGTVSATAPGQARTQQKGAKTAFAAALAVEKPQHREISRFPQVRRDIAVVVDESVALSALADRVVFTASTLLQSLRVFDVYRGAGVESGRKSVALGLIFQDISRTLTDDDVERLMAAVVKDLRESLNAKIRE
jgi:phenylalanyl-tRNA synthetase beta chain